MASSSSCWLFSAMACSRARHSPGMAAPKFSSGSSKSARGHAVLGAEALHVVAGGGGVQQVPRQGRVHADGLHLAAQLQGPAVEGLCVVGVLPDAVILKEGPQKGLVGLYPVHLPPVGEHQAFQGAVFPLGVEDGLSRVLQHGQQGGRRPHTP